MVFDISHACLLKVFALSHLFSARIQNAKHCFGHEYHTTFVELRDLKYFLLGGGGGIKDNC